MTAKIRRQKENTRENDVRDNESWIGTFSGLRFWPLDAAAGEINIEDIAHALSKKCRFAGHCEPFYSVAEHSVEVSLRVSPQNALWGLLHDAAEAYLGDIVRPLKKLILLRTSKNGTETYESCEIRLMTKIAERFGLAMPMPGEVAEVDDRMLATERAALFGENHPDYPGLEKIEPFSNWVQIFKPPAAGPLNCLADSAAEQVFLWRFKELTGL
jgi:hypothetical protein